MVDFEYKDLFTKSTIPKQLLIEYDTGSLTNEDIYQESFTLEESLCSERTIHFGACEASSISLTIANVFEPLKNKWLNVSMELAGEASQSLKLGRFKVYSDIPTADRTKREIVAYDALYDIINSDVSSWYNTILPEEDSTVTLKEFRNSFFEYFKLEQEVSDLPNDSMVVAKTIQPEQLSGKTVINAICEINGCFGNINRNGKFRYVFLERIIKAVYPSLTLYPRNDLYPVEPNGYSMTIGRYKPPCKYEDYTTDIITGLSIRQEENDIGVTVGTAENAYIIEDNFLVYGKGTEELEEIAAKIFEKIADISYRPFDLSATGNPCVEVGDIIRVSTTTKRIESYILQRTLKGIQALWDSYSATGEKSLDGNVNSVSNAIIQLKGKANVLTRTLEETRLEMTDLENGLSNTISATASQLRTELSNTKDELNSSLTQTASQIRTELSNTKSGLESSLTQTASQIRTELSDTEQKLSSSITQTASSLKTELSNTEKKLSSSISQTASQIRSEVSDSNADLQSKITQNANSISSEVARATSAEGALSTKITQTDEKIRSDVKATYETITTVEEKVSGAKTAATSYTDTRLALYSTTTEMNSAISQQANSIELSVNKQITETKTYADTVASTAETNAKKDTANKLKSYSTTTEMNSAISLSETGILSTVSTTYETKTNASTNYTKLSTSISQTSDNITLETKRAKTAEEDLSARISVNASNIALKVGSGTVQSMIDLSLDNLVLTSSQIRLEGYTTINGGFSIGSSGNVSISDGSGTAYMSAGSFVVLDGNGGASYVGGNRISTKEIQCKYINGAIPINSGNIDNYIQIVDVDSINFKIDNNVAYLESYIESIYQIHGWDIEDINNEISDIKSRLTALENS